jgi:hypothetical protein
MLAYKRQSSQLLFPILLYTPLEGQEMIVYGKITVPAPPPSGAVHNYLGKVGLRVNTMRATHSNVVYHA